MATGFEISDGYKKPSFLPKVKVIGVGGGGGNAVANMINQSLSDVEFWVANTDLQSLMDSPCQNRIQIGSNITSGLGAGANPEVGAKAALESKDEIIDCIKDAHVVFVAAGMGGGTGTGAAPVIAKIVKDLGILTVGIVTKPFMFEGSARMRAAEEGIKRMEESVDTLVVVMNQYLFRIANEATAFAQAFRDADRILHDGVKCISDLFTKPGLINLDLADVRAVISNRGMAMIGMGEAYGADRAERAVELAITNPLLDETLFGKAEALLLNISGSVDMTLFEVERVANAVRDKISLSNPDAMFIVGTTLDQEVEDNVRVSVIAAGINSRKLQQPTTNVEPEQKTIPQTIQQQKAPSNQVGWQGFSQRQELHSEKYSTNGSSQYGQYASQRRPYREENSGVGGNPGSPREQGLTDVSEKGLFNDLEGGVRFHSERTGVDREISRNGRSGLFSVNVADGETFGSGGKEGGVSATTVFNSDFGSRVAFSGGDRGRTFSAEIPDSIGKIRSNSSSSSYAEQNLATSNNSLYGQSKAEKYITDEDNFSGDEEDDSVDQSDSFMNLDMGNLMEIRGATDEKDDIEDEQIEEHEDTDEARGFIGHFFGSVAKKFQKQKIAYDRKYSSQDDIRVANLKKK